MTNKTTPEAKWSDKDSRWHCPEMDFSAEAIRAHLEYQETLTERALYLARICLEENLFNETLLPGEDYDSIHREKHHDYWQGCGITLTNMADLGLKNLGNISFELCRYIGSGDYATREVFIPALALCGSLKSFIEERRVLRDEFLAGLDSRKEAEKAAEAQKELDRKRALLEKLKRELGEA